MKKIVHVHTDKKFIKDTLKRYKCSSFENMLIVFGEQDLSESYSAKPIFLGYSKKGIRKALTYCNDADLVVVYDLDSIKSILVNRLPANIKVAWRFFGYELYHRQLDKYYSQLTQDFFQSSQRNNTFDKAITYWKKTKSFLKWRTNPENEFYNSVKRIDFFLGLYLREYQHLKKQWNNLPTFVRTPAESPDDYHYSLSGQKDPVVLLGNNRSSYNNHLDLLNILQSQPIHENIRFTLLFNYGQNGEYAQYVRAKAGPLNKVTLLEDFLPINEFKKMYASCSAFVMNGYRQMALGNVFLALSNGLKLYLSSENTLYDWLKEKQFEIYAIREFQKDIKTGEIALSEKSKLANYQCLKRLYDERSIDDFQDELNRLMED